MGTELCHSREERQTQTLWKLLEDKLFKGSAEKVSTMVCCHPLAWFILVNKSGNQVAENWKARIDFSNFEHGGSHVAYKGESSLHAFDWETRAV
jgi:hypothetical protein